ncbi:hypothetical protein GKC30_12475 [Pseudodesulfovibrio sp. F-1]|uniref:Uncharacterized protein n=1 Tax=Pseudodesulfovibrio alkaliphilus TaxID=2661613 RepID=A0A7K1KR54_9BACT|nr:hypothetical protein [Pseudodesulfovibrio alkaliphilus]
MSQDLRQGFARWLNLPVPLIKIENHYNIRSLFKKHTPLPPKREERCQQFFKKIAPMAFSRKK